MLLENIKTKNISSNINIELEDGSITTPKLADEAVTEIKIKDNSISEPKLQDNCVTENKIKDSSISTNKIKDNSISESKLQDDCVTTNKIKNENITKDKISIGLIDSFVSYISDASKIPDNSIEYTKIKDGTITGAKIKDNNISESKLQNNCVTENKIKDGSITNPKLANLSISENKLQDNSISTSKIKDGSITNSKFANLSISENKLQNSSVSTSKLQNSCVTKAKLAQDALNAVESSKNNSITMDKIQYINNSYDSIAIGNGASCPMGYAGNSVAIGYFATASYDNSTALGYKTEAKDANATAIGGCSIASAQRATTIGYDAKAEASNTTSLGDGAKSFYDNSTALARLTKTYAENQIVLGCREETPYAYRALSVISDKRDKTDIKDIEYNPLEFLNKLKPKQYRTDFRENYKKYEEISNEEYKKLDENTRRIYTTKYPIYEFKNGVRYIDYYIHDKEDSNRYKTVFKTKNIFLNKEEAEIELKKTLKKDDIENLESFKEKKVGEIILKEVFLESDGSMADKRYHNGFLVEEVQEVAKSMNFDFAGVKYLAYNGNGGDIYSITYEEFIAPIVASIQELNKKNTELKNKIEALEKLHQV